MNLNVNSRALEKLLDYTASGIGSTAGNLFAGWVARRKAEGRLIGAQAEVQIQVLQAESQAKATQIVSTAQADAKSILVSPTAEVQGQLDFGTMVTQRIQFQEEKRQANIGAIVTQAAIELGDTEVPDHEVDHDWTARFFGDAQDVSSEDLQSLWARVLAGEVKEPGSTSVKALNSLRNLDRKTAELFRQLCSVSIATDLSENGFGKMRAPTLGPNSDGNALKRYGLGFESLNVLNEHGLIISGYNSWEDIQSSIGIGLPGLSNSTLNVPFHFEGNHWILIPRSTSSRGREFKLNGIALTVTGCQLARVVHTNPVKPYREELVQYFQKNNLEMTEVASWQPFVLPNTTE